MPHCSREKLAVKVKTYTCSWRSAHVARNFNSLFSSSLLRTVPHGRTISLISRFIAHYFFTLQPQNEYIEEHIKRHGRRLDYFELKSVFEISPQNSNLIHILGASVKPVQLINLLQLLRRLSVSKPSFFTLGNTPKRFNSERLSKPMTSGTSSKQILPLFQMVLCRRIYSIVRVKRTPRPSRVQSSRSARTRRLNTQYHYPRFGELLRMRCSK